MNNSITNPYDIACMLDTQARVAVAFDWTQANAGLSALPAGSGVLLCVHAPRCQYVRSATEAHAFFFPRA